MAFMSLFRRRRSNQTPTGHFADILRLPPSAMVEIIHDMICHLDRNGGVMTLVAYKNQREINLPVTKRIHTRQVSLGIIKDLVPNSLESYIEFTVNSYVNAPDEPSRWRILWLINGLLLMKADEACNNEPIHEDLLADMWIHLIQCSRIFKAALEHNILWTDEEKSVCLGVHGIPSTERKGMLHCVNSMMPRRLYSNEKMINFLKPLDIRAFFDYSGFSDWQEMGKTKPPKGWGRPSTE
jgi:hypothetical protein